MKKNLHIVKVGGHLVNDSKALDKVLSAFASLDGAKILIHGGGRHATGLAKKLGLTPKMIHGRRITDVDMLDVAVMSYAGLSNKKIIAALQDQDVNALGLSGADGNCIQSLKRPVTDIDYGLVGDIIHVNTGVFDSLITQGFVPVLCAITHDKNGQLLNTNADTIAAQVAIAMNAIFDVRLFYCFEHAGVLHDISNPTDVISSLTEIEMNKLIDKKIIHQGMVPKLSNGFDARKNGVGDVIISNVDALINKNAIKTVLK
ncbi:MAG: acetylglutamate kinase [Flavobacteriaceae bacterium]|nr:acetylglutamate kinase [Flavobacteriaceae bacterium]